MPPLCYADPHIKTKLSLKKTWPKSRPIFFLAPTSGKTEKAEKTDLLVRPGNNFSVPVQSCRAQRRRRRWRRRLLITIIICSH